MRKQYLLMTGLMHRTKDCQEKSTIKNVVVFFIPDIDIDCRPPYVKGKITSKWVSYRDSLDIYDKDACERKIGMSLQPIPEELLSSKK